MVFSLPDGFVEGELAKGVELRVFGVGIKDMTKEELMACLLMQTRLTKKMDEERASYWRAHFIS